MSHPDKTQTIPDQIRQAMQAIETGASQQADRVLGGLETKAPNLAIVHYLRARLLLNASDKAVGDAMAPLRKALLLDPGNGTCLSTLTQISRAALDDGVSIKRAQRAVVVGPKVAANHLAVAAAAITAGEMKTAQTALRRSHCVDPAASDTMEAMYRQTRDPDILRKLGVLSIDDSPGSDFVATSVLDLLSKDDPAGAEEDTLAPGIFQAATQDLNLALAVHFMLADQDRIGAAWRLLSAACEHASGKTPARLGPATAVAGYGAMNAGNLDDAEILFRNAAAFLAGSAEEESLLRYAETCAPERPDSVGEDSEPPTSDLDWYRRPNGNGSALFIGVDGGELEALKNDLAINLWETDHPALHIHVTNPVSSESLDEIADRYGCAITTEVTDGTQSGDVDRNLFAHALAVCSAETALRHGHYRRVVIVDPTLQWFPRLRQLLSAKLQGDFAVTDHPWRCPEDRFDPDVIVVGAAPTAQAWLHASAHNLRKQIADGATAPSVSGALFVGWFHLVRKSGLPAFRNLLPLYNRLYRPRESARSNGQRPDAASLLRGGRTAVLNGVCRALMSKERHACVVDLLSSSDGRSPAETETRTLLAISLSKAGRWDQVHPLLDTLERSRMLEGLRATAQIGLTHAKANRRYVLSLPRPANQVDITGIDNSDIQSIGTAFSEKSTLNQSPFVYRIAGGLFPAPRYDALLKACAEAEESPDTLPPALEELLATLSTNAMVDTVVRCLGVEDLRQEIEASGGGLVARAKYRTYKNGYSLGPHRDDRRRFASLVAYLPEHDDRPDIGTTVYRSKTTPEEGDHGLHKLFEDFEAVDLSPYVPNSGIMFLNFGNAYHGVAPIREEISRRTLLCTLYLIDKQSGSDQEQYLDD